MIFYWHQKAVPVENLCLPSFQEGSKILLGKIVDFFIYFFFCKYLTKGAGDSTSLSMSFANTGTDVLSTLLVKRGEILKRTGLSAFFPRVCRVTFNPGTPTTGFPQSRSPSWKQGCG